MGTDTRDLAAGEGGRIVDRGVTLRNVVHQQLPVLLREIGQHGGANRPGQVPSHGGLHVIDRDSTIGHGGNSVESGVCPLARQGMPLRMADQDLRERAIQGKGRLHPWKGETIPELTDWEADKKYSWVRAPRFQGKPMQVTHG